MCPIIFKIKQTYGSKKRYALEKTKAIPDHQSGFRAHRSTEDQLFRLAETVGRAMRHRQVTVAAFLDFKGAFNSVWHDGLRYKLAKSPIAAAPGMVRWLSNFLQGRQFCTRVGAMLSDCKAPRQVYHRVAAYPLSYSFSLRLIYSAHETAIKDRRSAPMPMTLW